MELQDLAVKIDILTEKVSELPVIKERVDNWIENTIIYRQERDTKEKEYNKQINRIIDEIMGIREGCIRHIGNNAEFKRHLQEHKEQKSIWSNRGFQILIFIMTCIWGGMFFFAQRILNSYGKQMP